MKTIYKAYLEGDEYEVEGMFEADGTALGIWSCNDGGWRGEYFDSFLEALGIKVEYDFEGNSPEFDKFRERLAEWADQV